MEFLYNAWYVAAWDREVTDKPFARTIMNEPVMLFRKADGGVVALEDRCAHRHLPLSLGTVEGDQVRCGYHGMAFGDGGACVDVPGQTSIPPEARVRAYPVIEKYNWIWIWMGAPDKADAALLPDWWWADHPDWAWTKPDPIYIRCNYHLITENVTDTGHLAYVHASTIGASSIHEFPVRSEREERLVRMIRMIPDRPPPPMYRDAGGFKGNVDRWQIVEFVPPCYSVNDAGCAEVGTGALEGDRSQGIELRSLSVPTPESETTTHYFFGFVRSFAQDDPAIEKVFAEDFVDVFLEDKIILEGQQRIKDAKPAAPEVDINVDGTPLGARRMLQALIDAEREGGADKQAAE